MSQQLIEPTNLPTPELFKTPEGKQWRLAGTKADGLRYFVPAHLDPVAVRRTFWASETDLVAALGALTPLAVSA